ncbi:MAG: calcium-binding protein [Methyloceanibacter sp.]|nr:calcium-binding protein [Methyloceanibacter sp.]
MVGTYQDFLDALGQRESGGDYRAVNQFNYLGKYQMGEGALIDTGYYTPDGTSRNDWQPSHFNGKGGIDSKAEFLGSPAAQEAAIRAYMDKQWQYIASVQKYDGQSLGGVKITISGMLAGAHLVGNGGVKTYLNSGGDIAPVDGNNVSVASYVKKFASYGTPHEVDHSIAESIVGGSHSDRLFGHGGNDTLSGRGGRDFLEGGAGDDMLLGGGGADRFLFRDLADGGDTIRDFTGNRAGTADRIIIDTQAFGGEAGARIALIKDLDAPLPPIGTETIIYDKPSGEVYYDADGAGHQSSVLIATLTNHAILHVNDVLLI